MDQDNHNRYSSPLRVRVVEKLLDVSLALSVAIVFLPVIGILMVLSWRATDQSPIFRQKRIGAHGKRFTLYKIRTYSVTRKLSSVRAFMRNKRLDELPQLWNVLKGDIGIVGVRSLRVSEAQGLTGDNQAAYFNSRHGLTGQMQMHHGSKDSQHENISAYAEPARLARKSLRTFIPFYVLTIAHTVRFMLMSHDTDRNPERSSLVLDSRPTTAREAA